MIRLLNHCRRQGSIKAAPPPTYAPARHPSDSMKIRFRHSSLVLLAVFFCLASACNEKPPPSPDAAPDSTQVTAPAVTDSLALKRQETREILVSTLDSLEQRIADLRKDLAADQPKKKITDVADIPDVGKGLSSLGFKLLRAIIIIVITFYFIRLIVWVLGSIAEQSATRRLFFKKLIPITRTIVWSISIYYLIRVVVGVDGQSLALAGGAVGVAVGFAAQDVIKNIFGGIIIILDQPFQVGDRVKVEGTYGEVVSIGLRSTRIVTPDDNLVTVPNTQVVDGQVANANSGALDCQVVTELYLPGWVDVVRAKEIAHSAAATSRYVYLNKPIVVLIKDQFDHSFLTKVVVKAYVLDARYENLFASDVTERAKSEFLKEGLLQPMYVTYFETGAPKASESEGGQDE